MAERLSVLHSLLADLWAKVRTPPPTKRKAGDAQVLRIAGAELKALESVARAALKEHPESWHHRDANRDCSLCRALARLDKVRGKR